MVEIGWKVVQIDEKVGHCCECLPLQAAEWLAEKIKKKYKVL